MLHRGGIVLRDLFVSFLLLTSCAGHPGAQPEEEGSPPELIDSLELPLLEWDWMGGGAWRIGVGSSDNVWIVDRANFRTIRKLVQGVWVATPDIPAQGPVYSIAAGGGLVLATTWDGTIYARAQHDTTAPWWILQGCAQEVAINATSGTVWSVGCNNVDNGYEVQSLVQGAWQTTSGRGVHIAVSNTGIPWVTGWNKQIHRKRTSAADFGPWDRLTGYAYEIAISDPSFPVVVGSGDDRIARWNGSGWQKLSSFRAYDVDVEPSGRVWSVDFDGNVRRSR